MRIAGSIPLHVARAYGLPRTAAAPTPTPATNARATATNTVRAIDGLVAARTSAPVEFDAPSAPVAPTALPLYNRAADRVEAAVAIQLGRTLDVTG